MNFGEYPFRNCLENSRRLLERRFLPPGGGRSTPLRALLGAYGDPIRAPFRFSKQFRKGNSKKFAFVSNLLKAASLQRYLTTTSPFMPSCSWPSTGQYIS